MCPPPSVKRNASEKDICARPISEWKETEPTMKIDGRKKNMGAAVRKRFSSRYKVEFVDSVNKYLNEDYDKGRSVATYFRDVFKCRESGYQNHCNNYYNWKRFLKYIKLNTVVIL